MTDPGVMPHLNWQVVKCQVDGNAKWQNVKIFNSSKDFKTMKLGKVIYQRMAGNHITKVHFPCLES